jgi:hypothetical protein
MIRPSGSMVRTGRPVTRSSTVVVLAATGVPAAVVVVMVRVQAAGSTEVANIVVTVSGPSLPPAGLAPGAQVMVRCAGWP